MKKLSVDWKSLADRFFNDTAQGRATMLVQMLLVLWLGASLADLTWKLWPGPEPRLEPPPVQARPSGQAAGGGSQAPRRDISRWHLFGEKPAAGVPARPAVADLPETQLNLTLRGVVASDVAGESGAIIGTPDGLERFYGINDELPGGAMLTEVFADRVVLERNGRLETLRLPKEALDQAQGRSVRDQPPSPGQQPTLAEVRDMVLSDPQRVSDLVRIAPHSEGGRFIGYELQPGRDAALLNRLGLEPGDVVTSVNGVELNSPAKALNVLRTLAEADRVRVNIQRNGVPRSLVINLAR